MRKPPVQWTGMAWKKRVCCVCDVKVLHSKALPATQNKKRMQRKTAKSLSTISTPSFACNENARSRRVEQNLLRIEVWSEILPRKSFRSESRPRREAHLLHTKSAFFKWEKVATQLSCHKNAAVADRWLTGLLGHWIKLMMMMRLFHSKLFRSIRKPSGVNAIQSMPKPEQKINKNRANLLHHN